jgi:hypothetical protein
LPPVRGETRYAQTISEHRTTCGLIDFKRPTGVSFVPVLHFVTDAGNPGENVAAFRWRTATGSMLPISHMAPDGTPTGVQATVRDPYAPTSALAALQTRQDIEMLVGGPGLAAPGTWRSLREALPLPPRFLGRMTSKR